jgi:nucleoside-diphosphate-sugar epimerase
LPPKYTGVCIPSTAGWTTTWKKQPNGRNVGGGEAATVWDIIHKLEALAGRRAVIRQELARPGDQRYTFADTAKLRTHLGWEPRVGLDEGLARQWAWQQGELD